MQTISSNHSIKQVNRMTTRFLILALTSLALYACGGGSQFDSGNPNAVGQDPQVGEISSTAQSANKVDPASSAASTNGNVQTSTAPASKLASSSSSTPASSIKAISSQMKSSQASSVVSVVISCPTPPGKSHNAGQNCLSCHKKGGSGSSYAVFTLAGTAYQANGKAQSNAKIKIFDHNSNNITLCLTTNKLGNFYTTQAIAGLATLGKDVMAEGPTGGLHTMTSTLTSGACNSCHGVTAAKILAN